MEAQGGKAWNSPTADVMTTAVRQPHQFRRYRSHDEASNWRLVPWVLLGIFDLALWGYLFVSLWSLR